MTYIKEYQLEKDNQQRPWIAYQCELQNLSIAIHQPHPPAPAEPLREVTPHYTDTLCTIQKQSNLTNCF